MKFTKKRIKEIIREELLFEATRRLKEGKRKELEIHVMDKLKVDKILKKLKLKPGKDYDVGVGSSRSFMLDIDVKHLDKVIASLMQNRIRTK
tara:strand:+ start:387 stop:662 length:276 start_codon:yes stop_codon:yes gene_type:complete